MAAKEFGEKLKEVRIKHQHTQDDLGRVLGVGTKQIQRYESGEVIPDHDKIKTLCVLYSIDFISLIYDVPREVGTSTDIRVLSLMEERIKELKEDKEWFKKTFEISLSTVRGGVDQISLLLESATEVVLQSLERLEKKKKGALLDEADNTVRRIMREKQIPDNKLSKSK